MQSPSSSPSLRVYPPEPTSPASLSINYLPSKFTNPTRRRGLRTGQDNTPKRGGGREAFRNEESRMPTQGDEDYDGVVSADPGKKVPMRWNRFKWSLLIANTVLSTYSLVGLILCLLTWFKILDNARVVVVGSRKELILSTIATSTGVVTSLIGWSGILLNNRAFLAIYTYLLWIMLVLLAAPGYIAYKRHTFNLEGKIGLQWSRKLGAEGRLTIQNALGCCGFFNPFAEASVSQACYARALLPGCKLAYLKFQREELRAWYTVVFSIIPVHILVILAALLCSNHVTYRFGKGMLPKAYRLTSTSAAAIIDDYAERMAEAYGDPSAFDLGAIRMVNSSSEHLLSSATPMTPTSPSSATSGPDDFPVGMSSTGYSTGTEWALSGGSRRR